MIKRLRLTNKMYAILLFLFVLKSNNCHGSCNYKVLVSQKIFGYYWKYSYGIGAYRTFGSINVKLQKDVPHEQISPNREIDIFKTLFKQIYLPKYMLLQLTIYPLATLSSFLETDRPQVFKKFEIYNHLNMLRAAGGDFEEPYAMSLFLGNIIGFQYKHKNTSNTFISKKRESRINSILSGFLLSAGHLHIQDNIRISDSWAEILLMLTGKWEIPKIRNTLWDFRMGYRYHENKLVTSVAVFSFKRDHTEWQYSGWFPSKNSMIQAIFYMPVGADALNRPFFTRQLFLIGKKFPIGMFKRRIMLKIGLGMLWEQTRLYDRDEKKFDDIEHRTTTWLIQPSIEM